MMAMVVVSSCSGRCRCRRQSHQDAAAGRAHSSPHAPARARAVTSRKGVPSGRSIGRLLHCYLNAQVIQLLTQTGKARLFPWIWLSLLKTMLHLCMCMCLCMYKSSHTHLTDRLTLYIALVRKIPVQKSCVGLLGIRRRRSSATRGNATWRSIARALA